MTRRTMLALSVCLLLGSTSGVARADCALVPVAAEIRTADVIFTGTVSSLDTGRVVFHVDTVYKGNTSVVVSTPTNRRFYLAAGAVGQRYVVFLRRDGSGALRIDGCGNTQSGPGVAGVLAKLTAAGLSGHPPTPLPPPG